jgi:drug/metabolite transporter (DMT)-like permease
LRAAFRSALTTPAILVAVSLASASGMFVLALNHTTVAHVLVIEAMAPIIAALLGARVLHEPVSARTWATMLLAMVGVVVMVGASGRGRLTGDAMAFGHRLRLRLQSLPPEGIASSRWLPQPASRRLF